MLAHGALRRLCGHLLLTLSSLIRLVHISGASKVASHLSKEQSSRSDGAPTLCALCVQTR